MAGLVEGDGEWHWWVGEGQRKARTSMNWEGTKATRSLGIMGPGTHKLESNKSTQFCRLLLARSATSLYAAVRLPARWKPLVESHKRNNWRIPVLGSAGDRWVNNHVVVPGGGLKDYVQGIWSCRQTKCHSILLRRTG